MHKIYRPKSGERFLDKEELFSQGICPRLCGNRSYSAIDFGATRAYCVRYKKDLTVAGLYHGSGTVYIYARAKGCDYSNLFSYREEIEEMNALLDFEFPPVRQVWETS